MAGNDQHRYSSRRTLRRVLVHIVLPWVIGGLLLVAGIRGCAEVIHDWPVFGYSALGVWVALMLIAGAVDVVNRRRARKLEDELGAAPCPACSKPFGAKVAHQAMHPPPPPTDGIYDDFGISGVQCPHCHARYFFSYQARSLELRGGNLGRGL